MKKIWIMALCLAALTACNKKEEIKYPECVQTVIDNGSTQWLEIREYQWQSQTVYLFIRDAVTIGGGLMVLYNTQCQAICNPDGQFPVYTDARCPDFLQTATLVKTVWKK